MSYYYTYYIGYQDKDDKVYPLGPYDYFRNLCPVLCRSRTYASDLYKNFHYIEIKNASKELQETFPYEFENKENEKYSSMKMLNVNELPSGSFIKSGYFLMKDVKAYEAGKWDEIEDLFQETISPTIYSNMLSNELLLSQNSIQFLDVPSAEEEDNDENKTTYEPVYTAADYMYYSYPDFNSKEYEAHLLKEATEYFSAYDKKLVVLLVEG